MKIDITSVVKLPLKDAGVTNNLARLHNFHIGSELPRRSPITIINPINKYRIVRYALGNSGNIKGLTKNAIALDYDALCELDVIVLNEQQNVKLIVKKASLWESFTWLAHHSDLNVKLSFRLALLGAALGICGLAISLLSLF